MKSSSHRDVAGIPSPVISSDTPHAPAGQPLPLPKKGRGPAAGRLYAFARRWFLSEDATPGFNGILRLLVGGAFMYAGVLKIADPAKFALDVGNYRLVPHEWTHLVAILFPWIEVAAGLFVLAGIWLRAAALVSTMLTGLFFFVIVSALARGLNIECGCFGTMGGHYAGLVQLALDATLFALAALLAMRSRDCPVDTFFGETGAQHSALPLEDSPKVSSATGRVSHQFVCSDPPR